MNSVLNQLSLESILNKPKEKGGFFDLEEIKVCNHPEHTPPSHIHIPQGKGYKHVCPSCGKVSILMPPQISF